MTKREPRVAVRTDQPYVTIPIEVPDREVGRAIALFGELAAWVAERGAAVAGPPFIRYWVIGDAGGKSGLEVGVPVSRPVAGDGRVFAATIDGGRYATVLHEGPPATLPETHGALREWAGRVGIALDRADGGDREVWAGLYEFYLTDPAAHPDQGRWATEIACRIREEDEP